VIQFDYVIVLRPLCKKSPPFYGQFRLLSIDPHVFQLRGSLHQDTRAFSVGDDAVYAAPIEPVWSLRQCDGGQRDVRGYLLVNHEERDLTVEVSWYWISTGAAYRIRRKGWLSQVSPARLKKYTSGEMAVSSKIRS
jgi:hypothetical protein